MQSVAYLIAFTFLCFSDQVSGNDGTTLADVVAATADRPSAIASGTFAFTDSYRIEAVNAESQTQDSPQLRQAAKDEKSIKVPYTSATPNSTGEYRRANSRVTFSGNEWILSYPQSTNRVLSRENFSATLVSRANVDGEVRTVLNISDSEDGLLSGPQNVQWRNFLRGGTIPDSRVCDFMVSRIDRVNEMPPADVNGIACRILEWQLDLHDVANWFGTGYFGSMGPIANNALFRVYVAPSLGYATPQIDFVDSQGIVHSRYESDDFKEVKAGLFVPMHFLHKEFHRNETRIVEFIVTEASSVNDPIPDSVFTIDVPAGTEVSDDRPGKAKVFFRAGDDFSMSRLDEAVFGTPHQQVLRPGKASATTWLIRCNFAILSVLLIAFAFRNRRRLFSSATLLVLLTFLDETPVLSQERVVLPIAAVLDEAEEVRLLVANCGPIALARLSACLGGRIGVAEITQKFSSKSADGVVASELLEVSRQLLPTVASVRYKDIRPGVIDCPAILLVNEGRHCIVAESSVDSGSGLLVFDPSTMQHQTLDCALLRHVWDGKALIVHEPPDVQEALQSFATLVLLAYLNWYLFTRLRNTGTFAIA